jgi:hypothetical protein
MYAHRRFMAATALLAFLIAIAFPALAVVRQAVDPAAFATICRVDAGTTDPAVPGTPQSRTQSSHCVMCLGTVSPPPAADISPVVVAAVPELVVLVDRSPSAARDLAALQPLNPRAPPRG